MTGKVGEREGRTCSTGPRPDSNLGRRDKDYGLDFRATGVRR